MSAERRGFVFAAPGVVPGPRPVHVAHLPRGLATRNALFDALMKQLSLPAYFGRNWDALSECLRDLHWLAEGRVVLVHADIPPLPPGDLHQYLDVLATAIADWKPEEPRQLVVVFPAHTRRMVNRVRRIRPRD